MSSKLLRPESDGAVQPMVWPAAGRPAPAGTTTPPAVDPAAEAARQIAAMRAETERQVREAREAGRREGEAAGRRAAEAEMRPIAERLTRSIEEIATLRPALMAQAEAGLVKLSVAIARRILHREITLDGEALAGIVRAAMAGVRIDEIRRVRAHPSDAAALKAALAESAALRGIAVEADAALERGAVWLETGRGQLDASVETQLAEIERGLADRLRGRS